MVQIDAGIAAHLGAGIDDVRDRIGGIERAMRRPPFQPFAYRINKSAVAGATGDLVIGIGSPKSGQFWDLRQLTIGGAQWGVSVAGYGLLVASSTKPTAGASTPIGWVLDEAQTLPLPAGYSEGQMRIYPPEAFYVVIVGPTANTEYDIGANVTIFESGPRPQFAEA